MPVYETEIPGVGRKFALVARGDLSLAVGYVLVLSVLGRLLMRAPPGLESRYRSADGR